VTVEIDTSTIPWMKPLSPIPTEWSVALSSEIEAVRSSLRDARVSSYENNLNTDGYNHSVLTKFHIQMGEDKTSFQVRVLKDGKWKQVQQPTFFSIKTVPAAGRLLNAVLSLSHGPQVLAEAPEGVQVQQSKASDEARAYAVELVASLIRKDVEDARRRVSDQVNSILMDPEFMGEAIQVWEDALRKDARAAFRQIRHIPREYVRRFVDELIVEDVQES
jgi:hypothetical protein